MDDRIKSMIEAAVQDAGLAAQEWREGDDGPEAVLGRFAAVEDSPEDTFYSGDTGELTACVVGAQAYHNERVCFNFKPDGMTDGDEVTDIFMLEPA